MSSVIIQGDSSGSVTLQAPAAAGSTVVNLPSTSMNMGNGGGNVPTNTAFGAGALAANTTGTRNTAVGYNSLNVATADYNTAVGYNSLLANTTGNLNTAVGDNALVSNTTGSNAVAVGQGALNNNTTGNSNTALGRQALTNNTTGAENVAIGGPELITNTWAAMRSNTTGAKNVAVGNGALASNTTASNNTAVGYQAGYSSQASSYNTFLGYQAGYTSNAGSTGLNTCVGYVAGYSLTTGTNNLIIGTNPSSGAGYYMTTGSKNTLIGGFNGNQGGLDIRTASNYIVLSDGDGNPRLYSNANWDWSFNGTTSDAWRGRSPTNGLYIYGNGSNCYGAFQSIGNRFYFSKPVGYTDATFIEFNYDGSTAGTITKGSGLTTAYNTSSDYRLKENIQPMQNALAVVAQLKPCTYTWKDSGDDGQGFIAHELQEVVPDAVTGEKDGIETYVDADGQEQTRPKYQGIDTSFLVATLTAAIQELNAKVEAQAAEIATLKGQA